MALPRSRKQTFSREEETQWIQRSQSGDAAAFRTLVERYEERAFWLAYHTVGQVEDAQDIVQEAFIRVYRALPRFRLGMKFYTWFYQIVLHLSIDALRRRRDQRPIEGLGDRLPARQREPLAEAARRDLTERVQEVLDSLPSRERAILVLRDIEGLSGKEIAEITRSNQATVRWWLYRARKQFRSEWERRYGEEDPCA